MFDRCGRASTSNNPTRTRSAIARRTVLCATPPISREIHSIPGNAWSLPPDARLRTAYTHLGVSPSSGDPNRAFGIFVWLLAAIPIISRSASRGFVFLPNIPSMHRTCGPIRPDSCSALIIHSCAPAIGLTCKPGKAIA